MSSPLPLPSKAAIRALRSLAFGTSCALGVIIEDRRRRISTLKTAVSNKEKLKSSRKYHRASVEQQLRQLSDSAAVNEPSAHSPRIEVPKIGERGDAGTTDHAVPGFAGLYNGGRQDSRPRKPDAHPAAASRQLPSQRSVLQARTPRHMEFVTKRQPLGLPGRQLFGAPPKNAKPLGIPVEPTSSTWIAKPTEPNEPTETTETPLDPIAARKRAQLAPLLAIEDLLVLTTNDKLDQAVSLFRQAFPRKPPRHLLDRWLKLLARFVKECQARGRWEDASYILTTAIRVGPLDEAQYLAYDPSPIIEFHLRPPHPGRPCSEEDILAAAKIYMATLEEHKGAGAHMEHVGRLLMLETIRIQRFNLARKIIWRTLRWTEDPTAYVRWAIQATFERKEYKAVIRIFVLQYSRMKAVEELPDHPNYKKTNGMGSPEEFQETMNYVLEAIRATNALKAGAVVEALAEMEVPEHQSIRTRWVMELLQAHWARDEDISQTKELFERATSLGLLEKVAYPQAVYRTMVEIAVRAGDEETARSYADKVIHDYPDMKNDISLKLVPLKAKAGDWDGVRQTFQEVRPSDLADPTAFDDAFVVTLKIYAHSHSATETQDFTLLYIRDMGVRFHPYMVTILATKFGESRDMKGFMTWLEVASEEGCVLDSSICNLVLRNCSTTWNISYPELRAIHSKLEALNPGCSDSITQRILSQAAQRESKAFNRACARRITVSEQAYAGRSADKREIYEAMNHTILNRKPRLAVTIYKRARDFGMPFCSHCLRLAVLASLRGQGSGSGSVTALAMIQEAHDQGHEVAPAVATFIKCHIDAFQGSAEDAVTHMRNLISRFEESQIAIAPAVLTRMAMACVEVGELEKTIALCRLARDRSGSPHLCFSRQSFQALATAYSRLFDVKGMVSLLHDLFQSEFSTDKTLLAHLKSIRRSVKKKNPSYSQAALLESIDSGIERLTNARYEARTQGKMISQETLRIVGDAVANLQRSQVDDSTYQHAVA